MPRSRFPVPRPRSVWVALGAGIAAVVLVALTVLTPLLTLIGAASGAAWFVRVPFGTIAFVVFAGYLLAAGLLVLAGRTRRGAGAWILAVAATIAAFVVSVYPAVAAAVAGTEQAGDVIPFIRELIASGTDFLS